MLKFPVDSVLTEDLTVTGVSVGNLTQGKVLPSGSTALDILKEMLVKVIPPTYTSPSDNNNCLASSCDI